MTGGSSENIQDYICQIPKVGYGKNRLTGKIEHVGVTKRSVKKDEQYWERLKLPDDWIKRRKAEAKIQEKDPEYVDDSLEAIREQHWLHRLCGIWVMINGAATYIPPSFFYYLNYCVIDVGYPDYWETDRKYFYVWEYVKEDPRCGGFVDIEGRRGGKTYKAGSITLDEISLNRNHHGGIQSKTSTDSKGVFSKAVIQFFKKLPDFLRPVYDQSKGITPTSELRFFQTTIKGKRAENVIGAEELESWIDYGSSDVYHYDGSKLQIYIMDEFGKTKEVSVWDRWNVVRFCLLDKGKWIGRAILTSTIEDMDNTTDDPLKLWQYSNPNERDANGVTKTGLYRFFVPAYEKCIESGGKKLYDKFGKADIEKTKQYYLNERAGAADDPRLLSSLIRKSPFNINEAFRIDGDDCLFDAMKLNIQLDVLSWKENLTERGDFAWKNGDRFSEIEWVKSANGRFEICKGFKMENANHVVKRNDHYYPNNTFSFRCGCDPFKYSTTKDSRRSDCAAFIYKMPDIGDRSNPFNDSFVCKYSYRAPTTGMQYEDILKMVWFFGCQVLFENNVNNWLDYFKTHSCEGFLMKLPGEKEYGLYSDGMGRTHQLLADYTEAYINEFVEKVLFKSLIKGWLKFTLAKTTPSDEPMGAGFCLIAARQKTYRRPIDAGRDVADYFPTYKAN